MNDDDDDDDSFDYESPDSWFPQAPAAAATRVGQGTPRAAMEGMLTLAAASL